MNFLKQSAFIAAFAFMGLPTVQAEEVALSTKEKLASLPLLPFTLTFDLIALPAKVMGIIYQP